jgi:monodechloroaminopyrrolnitrin synthase
MAFFQPDKMIEWLQNGEAIRSLDPLNFDDKLQILHLLNRAGDTKEIIQLLYRTLPVPSVLDSFNYIEAMACMRDLGIFIGILKKHGIEPVEVVPELEYVLLVLMVKTALPPRDTLLHYTMCNPDGARMRTYSGLPDERSLIESVKIAMPSLMEAIFQLQFLHSQNLSGIGFEMYCLELRDKMEAMVMGIVHAKKNVSPAVFSNHLRFYYDAIKVDYNKEYIGPGAVEMPMFVFDHLLWSCDCNDEQYNEFKEGYLPFNLPFVQEAYNEFKGKQSLVSRVIHQLKESPSLASCRAGQTVLELCTVLKSFRMPHKKLAESAYNHTDEHHRTKGSGGYSTDILQHIINLQNERIALLQLTLATVKETIVAK